MRYRSFPGLLLAATLSLPAYALTPSRVDMSDLSIDTTEVTIGQFARYADSRQLKTAAEQNGYGMEYVAGWEKRTGWNFRFPNGPRGAADEPAVHLSWHEANAYCQAAGGVLWGVCWISLRVSEVKRSMAACQHGLSDCGKSYE